MAHIFITYGDECYEAAKAKIVAEAKLTNRFDYIYAYGREDLSNELLASEIIKIKRGGGLWSWKPDIILSTMLKHQEGDILVYCDAGCSLYDSPEWEKIWSRLEKKDLIAQRIFQKTERWTRKEVLDYFNSNTVGWKKCFQYQATVIFKVSDFSKAFVKEWRDLMIQHPEFAMDVTPEERKFQHHNLIENRHDQTVYSALIYKYLNNTEYRDLIFTQWERVEDYDPICKQAIRATRLREGKAESGKQKAVACIKRLIKDFIYKPFYYIPLQWWYDKRNKNCYGK